MIEVTEALVREADARAQKALDDAVARAKENGTELAPEVALAIHKGAWAAVTGAEHVKVRRD